MKRASFTVLKHRERIRTQESCAIQGNIEVRTEAEGCFVGFLNDSQSTHFADWVSGKEYPVTTLIRVPEALQAGTYDLRIAITDPDSGKPAVRLAIEGEDSRMRYRLGTLRILPPRAAQ